MILIEAWSDIVCPFCYLGKRLLERALEGFEHRDQVRILWKSFELDPEAQGGPAGSLDERLARKYGRSVEWARRMHEDMTGRARELGLDYRFDRAVPANTFDAHRLIHQAARHGLQGKAKERLCRGYYTLGEDIGDRETLKKIGVEVGLDAVEVGTALAGDAFAAEVRADEREAHGLEVHAVPFFLFNRKYAISGAQPVELFERALRAAWDDRGSWPPTMPGGACGPEGCAI